MTLEPNSTKERDYIMTIRRRKYNRANCLAAIQAGYARVHTEALANAAGVHQATVRQWMQGQPIGESTETAIRQALAEGWHPDSDDMDTTGGAL